MNTIAKLPKEETSPYFVGVSILGPWLALHLHA